MTRLALAALGVLAISGCTGAHIKKAAVCDGKHRRPANLYGTILPTLPVPLPASQGGGQAIVAPGPGPGPAALPQPPRAPALDAQQPAAPPPTNSTTGAASAAPRTSRRDLALSYQPC